MSQENEELIKAAKYGYDYHATTQFPDLSFEENCKNNLLQYLQCSNLSSEKEEKIKTLEARIKELEKSLKRLYELDEDHGWDD